MKMRTPVLVLLAVLLLAACGDGGADEMAQDEAAPDAEDESPEVADAMGPGTFIFESMGAVGELEIPAEPDEEIEELRELAGDDTVVDYIRADVDNREGEESVNMYRVNLYTPEGEELEYVGVSEYVGDITPTGEDVPAEEYNRYVDAYNEHLGQAAQHERREFLLIGPEVPEEIRSVQVYPHGGFEVVHAEPA
jgi:hypothetical protein